MKSRPHVRLERGLRGLSAVPGGTGRGAAASFPTTDVTWWANSCRPWRDSGENRGVPERQATRRKRAHGAFPNKVRLRSIGGCSRKGHQVLNFAFRTSDCGLGSGGRSHLECPGYTFLGMSVQAPLFSLLLMAVSIKASPVQPSSTLAYFEPSALKGWPAFHFRTSASKQRCSRA